MTSSNSASWIVEVKPALHCEPIWLGNITVRHDEGRGAVKEKARRLVAKHFDESAKILRIARGHITLKFDGPPEPFEE